MPKGHSTLEPRIVALEAQNQQLRSEMHMMAAVLSKRLDEMQDAFNRGVLPRPQYEQQFRIWPGANPITNGS